MTERSGGMAIPSTSLLASLVSKGDELKDACTKTYFGHLCVAFTTRNSLKHYSAFPWNFAIRDGDGWHHFYGIPNKVETRAKALRRAWHRAKWLHDGTWDQHYKANNRNNGRRAKMTTHEKLRHQYWLATGRLPHAVQTATRNGATEPVIDILARVAQRYARTGKISDGTLASKISCGVTIGELAMAAGLYGAKK